MSTMYVDTFPSLTFDEYVEQFVNILLTSTPAITDVSEGSVSLAFAEATAGNDIALQNIAYYVYNVARLGTSTGADVDSFVADFGLSRDPATFGTIQVQLSRNLTSTVQHEPVGSVVQTKVGQVQFQLIADPSQTSWDPSSSDYFFDVGQSSILVTVQCLVAGSVGQVSAGAINQQVSGLIGVSAVTNPNPVTNAFDQESDSELKLRFAQYIQSLSKGTKTAVEAAIEGVQVGLTYQLIEYFRFDGTPFAGFTAVVDDGSGDINPDLLGAFGVSGNTVYNAIDAVRALGISFEVDAPNNVVANVAGTVAPAAGFTQAAVYSAVTGAITAYVNGLGTGVTISYVGLANVVGNVKINGINCVFAYTNLTINGQAADFNIQQRQLARIGTVTLS